MRRAERALMMWSAQPRSRLTVVTGSMPGLVRSTVRSGRGLASTARNAKSKYVLPEEGVLLYRSNRKGEFRVQAGVALISCLAYGSYAWLQYDAKKQTGEFASSSATFTKVALGLGAVCVLTTPYFSYISARRAVRQMWAIPTSLNTNVASALRIQTYGLAGGPGKTFDLHLSDIAPVGKLNPTDRFVRFQVNGKRLFFLMSRDRGEFVNEQAIHRLLNNQPVTFTA